MPIDFRCPQCGKLLRTGDDTAGKSAQCPHCGAVTTVPLPGAMPSDSPQPNTNNPYQSPNTASSPPPVPPPSGIVPTILDVSDIFNRTWAIFKDQWTSCLAAWLIVCVLVMVISFVLGTGGHYVGHILLGHRNAGVGRFLGNLISQAVSIWFGIGLAIFFLKIARGRVPEFTDLFSGSPHFLKILLASLMFVVIFYVGLILCIVPGIILGLMFSQFYYLVLDRRLPVLDAFRLSKDLTNGNKMTLFLIGVLLFLATIAALIPCGLGILIVGPLSSLMFPVIYLTITGQPTAEQSAAERTM